MTHRFEMDNDGAETLILVFPPAAIRDLAKRLEATERLHGPLPEVMQAPVRGAYTNSTLARESSGSASEETPLRAA